jgi:tetratricopeptide (TPR) repeat protein
MRERALAAARAGRLEEAARLFDEAAAQHPRDAALLNSVGSFHAGQRSDATALAWFDRALALAPSHAEAALNRAIVLGRLGRARDAAADLARREASLRGHPRYWTARAAAELTADDPAAAQASYDAALRTDPASARAIQGRAQVALQRGADDAVAWHERALAAAPGDRFVVRGLAQAYEAAGRPAEALALTQALATQVPDWTEGMEAHAALRWAMGERDSFCDHYAAAAAGGASAALFHSWAMTLAGVDQHEEAADVAREGLRRWPDAAPLAVVETMAAGAAGDLMREERLLSAHDDGGETWAIHRARHRIRRVDPAGAAALLERVVATRADDIFAWSLLDVAWRMTGDDRHAWLSGQPGLVMDAPLALPPAAMEAAIALLHRLHDRAAMPVGQSVKDGSQTRGALFARAEPAIGAIREAIADAIERYRAGLPPHDSAHPLLRHRDRPWKVTGSWSIRLNGAGRHASHIHPAGIVSSASYFVVPPAQQNDECAGWLELGRPPSDLRTDLPAMATIPPRPGHAVLFPSTLFHGTRPIGAGTRMTVAFDVAAD